MSSRSFSEEFIMSREIRDGKGATELARLWKQHRLLLIVVLAATLALGLLVSSVMHAYSQSHYDYLTSVATLSRQAALS
jgi:hypothetical protein